MKRLIMILILAALPLLAACGNSYKITVSYGRELLVECPEEAKTGDVVKVRTVTPPYGKIHIRVDGMADFGNFTDDTTYEFFMPDEDVDLVVSIGRAGA